MARNIGSTAINWFTSPKVLRTRVTTNTEHFTKFSKKLGSSIKVMKYHAKNEASTLKITVVRSILL